MKTKKSKSRIHCFPPIVNKECKVIILGTAPSVIGLQKKECYGNPRNHFWKLVYRLFNQQVEQDYEKKKKFLLRNKIAIWNVIKSCSRSGSLDHNIRDVEINDFETFFKEYPNIKAVFLNGGMAAKLFTKHVKVNNGIVVHKLPSSSPANTQKFDSKLESWKRITDYI